LWGTLPGQGEQQNSAFASEYAMPPTIKENDTLVATPETASRPVSTPAPAGDAFKQQPVALEVEVTVNGARTIEGSDKREPFSETTKTVLVFGNGAVIRLTSSVAPGQLLFLTNEKTKKEVVCQVVKSKNYRNVSGYVELEFTESVVGFWGMRFPSDRIGSSSQPVTPAPVAVRPSAVSGSPVPPRPPAPRIEESVGTIAPSVIPAKPAFPAPVSRDPQPKLSEAKFVAPDAPAAKIPAPPKLEKPVELKPAVSFVPAPPVAAAPPIQTIPEVTVNATPAQPSEPASVTFDFPRASEVQASILEPPRSAASSSPSSTMMATSFTPVPELKPEAPAALPPAAANDPETEALKQHTARLQEQLSSMLFSEPALPLPVKSVQQIPAAPPVELKDLSVSAAQVLEIAEAPEAAPLLVKPAEPTITPAAALPSTLDEEELKIPAWLEPLARNAAAPSSTQELILREKARRFAEQAETQETAEEPAATLEERAVEELRIPSFANDLPMDEVQSSAESTPRKGKGLLIWAVAAGVLLLAGASWWFITQQSAGIHASGKPASQVQAAAVQVPAENLQQQSQGKTAAQTNVPEQVNSREQNTSPIGNNSVNSSNPTANSLNVAPSDGPASPVHNPPSSSTPSNTGTLVATSASVQPAPAQVKKSVLGELNLATPKVVQKRSTQNTGEAEAGLALSDEQPESNEALNAGLVVGNNQPAAPAAPLSAGGDVKPAKLIAPVAPSYPALAKSQHVSGNVLIDALIDANGQVTTMKVLSGPSLLHQAAMDALRQWKYQPASLNGKATAMHLTVTIQFRLQ
jgi:periplasmic protein TonB